MLEASLRKDNAFVTLTYNDENLPKNADGLATLKPEDVQLWLKRFRKSIEPQKVRYYLVGEYGEQSWRPHYHLAIFGYAGCLYGQSRYTKRRQRCCAQCDLVASTWGRGHVYLGAVEKSSAHYLARYTVKGMTDADDKRLQNRSPEFARMSLRSGIGYGVVSHMQSTVLKSGKNVDEMLDVPTVLRSNGKIMYIGRYLARKLREALGRDGKVPEEILRQVEEELLDLRWTARNNHKNPSFRWHLIKEGEQGRRNLEAKEKLFRSKRRNLL